MAIHRTELALEVLPQPDDVTCGPTCLHAVYRYWEHDLPLQEVIAAVAPLPDEGTHAVHLACHALERGFGATIYTYNLQIFDPTWFAPAVDVPQLLKQQLAFKNDPKLAIATEEYLRFLELGGRLRYQELSGSLLRRYLNRGMPILTGLSATYLYDCARELNNQYDDVRGYPTGHFVVLSGYDRDSREVMVADPLQDNPAYRSHYYRVDMNRLVASILLGIVTFDANLLIISPPEA